MDRCQSQEVYWSSSLRLMKIRFAQGICLMDARANAMAEKYTTAKSAILCSKTYCVQVSRLSIDISAIQSTLCSFGNGSFLLLKPCDRNC